MLPSAISDFELHTKTRKRCHPEGANCGPTTRVPAHVMDTTFQEEEEDVQQRAAVAVTFIDILPGVFSGPVISCVEESFTKLVTRSYSFHLIFYLHCQQQINYIAQWSTVGNWVLNIELKV